MIQEISIKNIATYDGTGTTLSNLKKINFMYGANGSGKTTLSNFIASQTNTKFNDCSLVWQGEQVLNTVVYNKEFRDNNFGKGSIEGVFTLGQATDEELKVISNKQDTLKTIRSEGITKKETLDKQEETLKKQKENFKDACWNDVYKKHEHNFKEAFVESMQKQSFKDKLLKQFDENSSELLTFEELNETSKTIFGAIPQSMALINNINYDEINRIEDNEIWNKKIIGQADVDIAKLIQKLNLNDWVHRGKSYLQDDDICPFCQQETITDDFKKQLESYFDKSFLEETRQISTLNQSYNTHSRNILHKLEEIESTHKNNPDTKLDVDKFSAYLKTITSQFASNMVLLSNKINEPSRSIKLVSTKEQLINIQKIIEEANTEIRKHNILIDNYKQEKKKLISSIWKYIAEEYKTNIEAYNKSTDGLIRGISHLDTEHEAKTQQLKVLDLEIKELTKNVTSVQPTVDEINKVLKYYGFFNFEIVPSVENSNQYQIQREDGTLAESTLSEGEITFITFLYFLQLAKGATSKDKISEERVLVIDDPISSLDSNVLFVVSTLIKDIIENIKKDTGSIKQLIVLTHNVYFHKEVSFINSRDTQGRNDTHFWILRKNNKISTFHAYEKKNPIQTSYQLLWQELKDKEKNSMVTIQNTMRRIIENYFKILGNYKDDTLIQKFTSQEKQVICKSLISWINDGSHNIADDLYIERQDDSVEKYLEVFKNIFIFTNHEGHYNMMMGIENE